MTDNLTYAQRSVVNELIWQGHKFIKMACNEAIMSNGIRVDYMGVKWNKKVFTNN